MAAARRAHLEPPGPGHALGRSSSCSRTRGSPTAHVPEVVVQFGAAPTSRAALELVRRARRLDHRRPGPPRRRSPPQGRLDPPRRAGGLRVPGLADRITSRAGRARGSEHGERRTGARELRWTRFSTAWDEPFEGRIARDVAASVPDGGVLVVGSSMPVRDLDAYMRPRDGLGVLANRGASGIDGFVSTALGVSATGAPTTALCGDLTLLHDVGSLIWSAGRGTTASSSSRTTTAARSSRSSRNASCPSSRSCSRPRTGSSSARSAGPPAPDTPWSNVPPT